MNGLSTSGSSAAAPAPGEAVGYGVGALGVVQASGEAVAGMRRSLAPPGGKPFAPAFLKPTEDLTVAALAAVLRAMQDCGLTLESVRGWGVIAAPRSFARLEAADALHRYALGGAWKVSPFLPAHHSLHSVSGTVTQALGIRGPNFGVGGTSGAVVEGMLSALALLEDRRLPGLWLVLAEADPEPVPDDKGVSVVPVAYNAVALGLVPAAADWRGLRLRVRKSGAGDRPRSRRPAPTVGELVRFLADRSAGSPAAWSCPLGWGNTISLGDAAGDE